MTTLTPAATEALTRRGIIDGYGPDALTAPVIAGGLTAKGALAARFAGFHDWQIIEEPLVEGAWVARWDRLTLVVADRTEVPYVARIDAERVTGRKALRAKVLAVVDELGLRPRSTFLYPA